MLKQFQLSLPIQLFLLICIVFPLDLNAAKSPTIYFTPEEQAWIDEHPNVSLGYTLDLPPAIIETPDGDYKGLVPDYGKLLSEATGIQIELKAWPSWTETVAAAQNGEIDIIGPITTQFADMSLYHFSLPTTSTQSHVYGKIEASIPGLGLDGLSGKNIGFIKSVRYIHRFARENPQINFMGYATTTEMMLALDKGEIEFFVHSGWFDYKARTHGLSDVRIHLTIPSLEEPAFLGIRKDWPELSIILNKVIAAQKEEVKAITTKWLNFSKSARTQKIPLTNEERIWLAQNPSIRVGLNSGWAPLEFIDQDGIPQGISPEYLYQIEDLLGIHFEYVIDEQWNETCEKLVRGEIDLIPLASPTESRTQKALFTAPYQNFPVGIFSTGDRAFPRGLDDLIGKTVVVIKGHAIEEWLRNDYPSLDIVTVPTLQQAIQTLLRKKATALVGNQVAISHYIGQSGTSQIKIVGDTEYTNHLAMAVRKDWAVLPGILQKTLDAIPKSEKNAIFNKWAYVEYKHSIDYRALFPWVAGASAILILSLFWNRKLHKEIQRRRLVEQELTTAKHDAETASDEAHQAAKVKSQFLANMSHEIRTPISSIISAGNLLHQTRTTPAQKDYLNIVSHSADALLETIDDILMFSKGEAGKIKLEQQDFEIDDVLLKIRQMFVLAAKEKNLSLTFEVSPNLPGPLRGDPQKVGQILRNLIANAIKFTDEGTVSINAELAELNAARTHATLRFVISDTGVGISPECRDMLFQPFNQDLTLDNRSREGTGLGLSISKQLADLMGGSISVDSKTGKGSTFTVEIPFNVIDPTPRTSNRAVMRARELEPDIQPIPELKQAQVLLVEDHKLNQMLGKTLLERYGAEVHTAGNGEEALAALDQKTFDLVFMDIQMPGMDGYETTRAIRKNQQWKHLPIVALSAHVLSDERENSLEAGMNDYVSKPFQPEQLKDQLLKWTTNRSNTLSDQG